MTASSLHSVEGGDDRVRVACRVKPQGPGASSSRILTSVTTTGDQRTVIWAGDTSRANGGLSTKHFTFDYAAGEDVGQEELFEKVRERRNTVGRLDEETSVSRKITCRDVQTTRPYGAS